MLAVLIALLTALLVAFLRAFLCLLRECGAIEKGLWLRSETGGRNIRLAVVHGRWLRGALEGRRETIRQSHEIVVLVRFVEILGAAVIAHLRLLLGGLRRRNDAEIMFGVLKIIFGDDRIAGRLGVARQLEIFFRNMLRGAANLDVRSVRLVGPRQRIRALAIISTTHTLVLTRSHR